MVVFFCAKKLCNPSISGYTYALGLGSYLYIFISGTFCLFDYVSRNFPYSTFLFICIATFCLLFNFVRTISFVRNDLDTGSNISLFSCKYKFFDICVCQDMFYGGL